MRIDGLLQEIEARATITLPTLSPGIDLFPLALQTLGNFPSGKEKNKI